MAVGEVNVILTILEKDLISSKALLGETYSCRGHSSEGSEDHCTSFLGLPQESTIMEWLKQ